MKNIIKTKTKEQMTIVIVGHVDHGKSTVLGRLFADTNSLPEGKLEQVKKMCERNSKPFEYAFLLDALKDEQAQGITIDSARSFFETEKRHYIVFDAPGHIEFLKNMITGAAHAEAALLVIDANEGIQENSKRHGYLLSMLGIKQVSVLVNKMDLVNYDQKVFDRIVSDYSEFLLQLNVRPTSFIPISARDGEGIIDTSTKMNWHKGDSVLSQLDNFTIKASLGELPFRFPVQDIYKFTKDFDDRRIIAGTVESGKVSIGDEVVFLPTYKSAKIQSIESFNTPKKISAVSGDAIGFTLSTQIYIKPGDIMVRADQLQPKVTSRIKANIFWMGKAPFIKGKTYKLKIATTRIGVKLVEIKNVIDASELKSIQNKNQIERHDVAEVILETFKPIPFDLVSDIEATSRFVIVDNYEISGGGIILDALSDEKTLFKEHIAQRENEWEKGYVETGERIATFGHRSKFIVFSGRLHVGKRKIAKALERKLFLDKHHAYYLGLTNVLHGISSDYVASYENKEEQIRRLGELARIMTDSGQIFITTISDIDDYDIEKLKALNEPNEIVVINVGDNLFSRFKPDLQLDLNVNIEKGVSEVYKVLKDKEIISLEYYI